MPSLAKLETRIKALGSPWPRTMGVYKQARDHQIRLINLSKESARVKQEWRRYQRKNYGKLLRKILKLASPAKK